MDSPTTATFDACCSSYDALYSFVYTLFNSGWYL